MTKRLAPYLIVTLFAVIPVLMWFAEHKGYPRSDAADYLIPVVQSTILGGFEGLRFLLIERIWKPVGFHLMVLPAFILTGGSISAAAKLTIVAIQVGIGLYGYALLRIRQTTFWSTAIAAVLLTLPFMVTNGTRFYTEASLALCVVGFYFHCQRALENWNLKSFGFMMAWFTVGVFIRPMEATLMLMWPLAHVIFRAWQGKLLRPNFLYALLGVIVLGSAVFLMDFANGDSLPVNQPPFYALRLIAFIAPFALVVFGFRQKYERALALGIATIGTWYLPFSESLGRWVYQCTFGELATRVGGRSVGDWPFFLQEVFRDLSGVAVFSLLALALVMGAWKIKEWKTFSWYWIPSILIIFALGFSARNDQTRYYSSSVLLLLIAIGSMIRPTNKAFRDIVGGTLLILLGLNFTSLKASLKYDYIADDLRAVLAPIPSPEDVDLVEKTFSLIKEKLPLSPPVKNSIAIVTLSHPTAWGPRIVDPWSLQLMALQERAPFEFSFGLHAGSAAEGDYIVRLRCHNQYLLLGPTDGTVDEVWDNGSLFGTVLIQAWEEKNLLKFGFSDPQLLTVQVTGEHTQDLKEPAEGSLTYLLLKTVPPGQKECALFPAEKRKDYVFR